MKRTSELLALAAVLVASVGHAQQGGAAPLVQPRATTRVQEVERGVFLTVSGGYAAITNPPANEGGVRPYSSGQMAQLELGVDLGERLALSVFVMEAAHHAGTDYLGQGNGPASGDFLELVPGAALRLNVVGFPDSQGTARTWLFLRGGVGYTFFFPKELLPTSNVLAFAGPGIEYYTHLRHFSIGLEVMGSYLVNSGALGFWVAPNVRYAF